jgi:hypothetical protein
MNRRLALWVPLVATLLVAGVARAQNGGQAEVTIGYQGLPYKASGESNTGIQVSDGVLLHVGAGAEAGYDTNVFYANAGAIASPMIRTSVFGDLSNATRTGAAGRISFDARAGVVYRRYQSDDAAVEPFRNAWMPTAGLALSAGGGQFGFGIADTFARLEDPPYNSGPQVPITRYNNQASMEGRWAPGGGRITATLRYTNMVDIFQGGYSYASTDGNYLMLDAAWKWLPKTAIFLNAQQGYIFYLNQAEATARGKESSFPLLVTAGLRGLLTEKTSATLALGYTNGFYAGNFSTGGIWGSTYLDLSAMLRPTILSRIVAGYRHDFTNAVVASFSYNETFYASYVQQIAGRLALDLSGRYSHRNYGGQFVDMAQMFTGRTDNFVQVGATLDYFIRNWIYAGVGYSLFSNGSNIPEVEYLKQQMFVRLGLTY